MKKIGLNLCEGRSYDIIIGKRIIQKAGKLLLNLDIGEDALIVTNYLIKKAHGNILSDLLEKTGFNFTFELVKDAEKSKSIKTVLSLTEKIAKYDKKKRIFMIAFGGGVVGDLTGFISAIYKRGIPYIQIPTTLLAQIDSSIGGKTGVDLTLGKNLIGAFYQPKIVISDLIFLSTLPKKEIRAGLAEAVKYGVIKDHSLFKYLEKNFKKILSLEESALEYLIVCCSRIKARIVEKDEKEKKGIRIILNFGHTIGHAIEAAGGYRKYNHGEAIALGMLCESDIAYRLGFLSKNSLYRIENLISKIGLPLRITNLRLSDILEAQSYDKKFISGVNRFVLPKKIGQVIIKNNLPQNLIKEVLSYRLK